MNSSFDEKFPPYELVFGKPVNRIEFIGQGITPWYNTEDYAKEIKHKLQLSHERARQLLEKSKIRNKVQYDRKTKPINVDIGSSVPLKKEPYDKNTNIYTGPYIIEEIMDPNKKIKHNDKITIAGYIRID